MIRLFELFAGYGSQSLALKRLGIEFENVGYCEIYKYAIQAHKALHGENIPNFGDITKVDAESLPDMDFLTYSFPCQDISVAGKGMGLSKDSGTRSSLLWECHKIIAAKKPKYLMMENVKNLVGKKNLPDFQAWVNELRELGYNNYYKVINAKDCGVPQNRERVFCVSIRRDVDDGTFRFNEPFDNGVRLKDLLEDEVEEKFYIADEKVEKLLEQLKKTGKANTNPSGKGINGNVSPGLIAPTLTTNKGEGPKIVVPCLTLDRIEKRQNGRRFKENGEPMFTLTGQDRHGVLVNECKRLGNIYGEQFDTGYAGNVWDKEGISPALMTRQGGGRQPHILTHNIKLNVKVRKHDVEIDKLKNLLRTHRNKTIKEISQLIQKPITLVEHWFRNDGSFSIPDADIWFKLKAILNIKTDYFDKQITEFQERQGVFEKAERVYDEIGISPTITCASANEKVLTNYRIRKLTPKECFRLMGLTDEEIQKIQDAGISNSQQYKMAGNSIVVGQMFFLKNLF